MANSGAYTDTAPLVIASRHNVGMSSMDPRAALRRHFGHESFRPGQEDVVRTALAGGDLLAVMPPGAGPTIGYDTPALLLDRTVSPTSRS
jgi:superfamily II DNA helicase RecQ